MREYSTAKSCQKSIDASNNSCPSGSVWNIPATLTTTNHNHWKASGLRAPGATPRSPPHSQKDPRGARAAGLAPEPRGAPTRQNPLGLGVHGTRGVGGLVPFIHPRCEGVCTSSSCSHVFPLPWIPTSKLALLPVTTQHWRFPS